MRILTTFLRWYYWLCIIISYYFQYVALRTFVGFDPTMPLFLWSDESQYLITSHDALFQSTARHSRTAVVNITQNLPNYYTALKSNFAQHEADSLLGNLNTKIFCRNSCPVTNKWASEIVGQDYQFKSSFSSSSSTPDYFSTNDNGSSNSSFGGSFEILPELLPQTFNTLTSGGAKYQGVVQTVVFQGGRVFVASGSSHIPVEFEQ